MSATVRLVIHMAAIPGELDPSTHLSLPLRRITCIVVFAAALAAAASTPLRMLESSWGLNVLYNVRGARAPPTQVAVIALNIGAAEALGVPARPDRWPRALHAELIDGPHAHGAAAFAFDLRFDRPRDAGEDRRLADAMRRAGNVVLVEYVRRDFVAAGGTVAAVDRRVRPMPLLGDPALTTAPFLLSKSSDGVLAYLAFAPQGGDLPTLPLALAAAMDPMPLARLSPAGGLTPEPERPVAWLAALHRAVRADPSRLASTPGSGVNAPSAARRAMLASRNPRVPLNFYGPPGHIETAPYDRAIAWLRDDAPEAARLRGRVVLVGLSESNQSEQRDGYRTPLSMREGLDVSGVELAAAALANRLDGASLRSLSPAGQAGAVALLAAAIFAPWLVWSPWRAAAASLGVALAYGVGACAAFAWAYLWLPVALPIAIALPAAALVGLVLRFREVERQRLHAALHRYSPTRAIAQFARELDGRSDTIYVVCMSSDIEDYTRRVEGRDPAAARLWLNAYFERVFPIIRAHGGHVVDHAGDSMVCIWLCGSTPCDACVAAVAAAHALHRALNATGVGQPFDVDAWPTRMGLHFGPVALGEVGDAQHSEPRVVGDIVNTASRIQSANKMLGTRLLVSDEVAAHLPRQAIRPLGRFKLTGKTRAIGLADPMPPTPELAALSLYAQALAARSAGRLEIARALLDRLLARCPHDGPARFLLSQLASGDPIVFDAK